MIETAYVKVKEDDKGIVFYRPSDGAIILRIDGVNRRVEIPSGTAFLSDLLSLDSTELGLLDGAVLANSVASKAAILDASKRLRTAANVGAVTTAATTSAVEIGDGIIHSTILTLAAFAVGNSGDNASLARGASLYTFPTGAIIVESAYMSIGLTLADAVQTDTPEMGLGTTACAGDVQATLGAVAATAENIFEGLAVTNVSGTAKVGTKIPTAGIPLIIAAADSHVVYLNVADGWANLTAPAAITATGTIILNWKSLA
jgi:hypothetical protein